MYKKIVSHPLWGCFREKTTTNSCFLIGSLLGNVLSACLEGASISLLWLSLQCLDSGSRATQSIGALSWMARHGWDNPQKIFFICILGALATQILRSLSSYIPQLMTIRLTARLHTTLQSKIVHRILHLSYPSLARYQTGDLAQYVSMNAWHLFNFMHYLNLFLLSGIMIGLYFVVLFYLSYLLTSYLILFMGSCYLIQKWILKSLSKTSQQYAQQAAELNSNITQAISGLRVIHLYHMQSHILRTLGTLLNGVTKYMVRIHKGQATLTPVNEILALIAVGSSLLIWAFFLSNTSYAMTTNTLLTFFLVSYRVGSRLHGSMQACGTMMSEAGMLCRIQDILQNQEHTLIDTQEKQPAHFHKAIEFHSVSLCYPHQKGHALSHISLTIPCKKTVALVGSSGGGKSSLLDLLMRLYEPSQGKILLDKIPIHQFSLASWRSLFGVVSQDVFLFHDTIEANIRYGCPGASTERLLEAARLAGVDAFVAPLPKQYQTVVGERGMKLSGGERQRIALARALIRKPEILVLDEATSHLDSLSEQLIQNAIETLRGCVTLIIVAHRLSTICHADEIIYLHEGVIRERGTHDELLALQGYYYRAWSLQSTKSSTTPYVYTNEFESWEFAQAGATAVDQRSDVEAAQLK